MHHQERPTIINDLITTFNNTLTPITGDTQAIATIISRVDSSKKKFKPWIPPKFCQYPNSPRTDDFSFSKGLGQTSLQPTIDSLNQFKQSAIMSIKAQFNAMGPEGSKDIKLAAGAADFIKQIYEAAKCFTRIVQNVNNLVNTYIQVINLLTVDVIQIISKLESETMRLLRTLLRDPNLKTIITIELFDALDKATDIYHVIGNMVELQRQLQQAALAVDTLANSKERILMHLQVNNTLIQNRINSFLRYGIIRDALATNLQYAGTLIMTNNFLDDFNLAEIQASSFNWSITNTAGLYEYNMSDELNIIPKLNALFSNYNPNVTNSLIIAAKEEEGYIFVPDLENGLISAGLDASLGTGVALILELSINNGDTIIRSTARGIPHSNNETIIHRNNGIYFSKSKEKIEYNKVITRETNLQWEIYLTETTLTPPNIGDYYYFKDPSTQQTWDFSITETLIAAPYTVVIHNYPALWQVINTSHNSVTLLKMDETNLQIKDFISDYNEFTKSYTISNTQTFPGVSSSANLVVFAKTKDSKQSIIVGHDVFNYFVINETTGLPVQNGTGYATVNDFIVTYPAAPINPIDDAAAASWTYTNSGTTYKLIQNIQYSITLNRYVLPVGYEKDSPHSGDKIPCLNWSLSVYPVGDHDIIKKIRFSREFIAQTINSFYLKAHWGFIPHKFTTAKSIAASSKAKSNTIFPKVLTS